MWEMGGGSVYGEVTSNYTGGLQSAHQVPVWLCSGLKGVGWCGKEGGLS